MDIYQYDKDYNYEIIQIQNIEKIRLLNKHYIYYEKLGDIVKPFFDIDIHEPPIRNTLLKYEKYYTTLFQLIIPNGDIAISSSHKPKVKVSFHFIINNLFRLIIHFLILIHFIYFVYLIKVINIYLSLFIIILKFI